MKLLFRAFIVALLLLPVLLSAESEDALRARAQKGEAEAQFQLAEYLTEWASDSQDIRAALAKV